MGRVDIITGTLGKVLAAHPAAIPRRVKRSLSGCVSVPAHICSPTLAPATKRPLVGALEMVEAGAELRDRLWANNARQSSVSRCSSRIYAGRRDHAIIPVMLGCGCRRNSARELQKRAFTLPVLLSGRTKRSGAHVPRCLRRIRLSKYACGRRVHAYW